MLNSWIKIINFLKVKKKKQSKYLLYFSNFFIVNDNYFYKTNREDWQNNDRNFYDSDFLTNLYFNLEKTWLHGYNISNNLKLYIYFVEITFFIIFLILLLKIIIRGKNYAKSTAEIFNYIFIVLVGLGISLFAVGLLLENSNSILTRSNIEGPIYEWGFYDVYLESIGCYTPDWYNYSLNKTFDLTPVGFSEAILIFNDSYIFDFYGVFFKGFFIVCSFILYFALGLYFMFDVIFCNIRYDKNQGQVSLISENNLQFFRNFILISSITQFFLVNLISSFDLLSFFVSLEGTTLCLYILAGLRTDNKLSIESGLKYFLVSAVFSCLFGFSSFLLYLITGSTNFFKIRESIGLILLDDSIYNNNLFILLLISVLLSIIVFIMKLGGVPYHFWIGDVYQGSPLLVTIFFSTIVRISFFAIFFRLIMFVFYFMTYSQIFSNLLLFFSVLSIVFGGIHALAQSELKRFLAYSSIVHTGFILLGLSTMSYEGFKASILYLVIYIFTLLCFLVIIFMFPSVTLTNINKNFLYFYRNIKYFSDFKKLPFYIKFCLVFFFFSMAGIPPFPGFIIKLYSLKSFFFELVISFKTSQILQLFSTSFYVCFFIFVVIVLASLVSSYNYIRVISKMLFSLSKELEYDAVKYYSHISYSSNQNIYRNIFVFLLLLSNFILIFTISYLYHKDGGLFDSIVHSIRHPFFNREVMVAKLVKHYTENTFYINEDQLFPIFYDYSYRNSVIFNLFIDTCIADFSYGRNILPFFKEVSFLSSKLPGMGVSEYNYSGNTYSFFDGGYDNVNLKKKDVLNNWLQISQLEVEAFKRFDI